MRLFIAIHFPREIKTALMKVRDTLQKRALRGHFTFDENLHLTLVFLGECGAGQLQEIKSVMDEVVSSELTLALDQAGCFKRDGGDIWWVGLKENRALSDLQADLSQRLKHKGFILESRRYTPHVTIGREVKMPAGSPKPEVPQAGFGIASIDLMKSERIHGKLVYTPVYTKKFPFHRAESK